MGNILSNNSKTYLTNNWKVLFNTIDPDTQQPIQYDSDDLNFIEGMIQARYNFLSKNGQQTNDMIELIKSIKSIAQNSRNKEEDFINFLLQQSTNSNSTKIQNDINNLYTKTFDYFDKLIASQPINIQYTNDEKFAINSLFWNDIGSVNEQGITFNDRGHFVAAIAALKSQNFFDSFAITAVSVGKTALEKGIAEELKKIKLDIGKAKDPRGDRIKNNISKELSGLSSKGKSSEEIAALIIEKVLKIVNEELVHWDPAKKLKENIFEELDREDNKNQIISSVNKNINLQNIGFIISDQYRLEFRKKSQDLIPYRLIVSVSNSAGLIKNIVKIIGNPPSIDDNKIKRIINVISSKLQINSKKTKNKETDNKYLINIIDISNEEYIIDSIKTLFSMNGIIYNSSTDDNLIDKLYDSIKTNIATYLPQLLEIWVQIISHEILKLKSVSKKLGFNEITANDYFLTKVSDNISDTIKAELTTDGSDLQYEILRAVDKYIKMTWNDQGHVSNFNGTISEIFVTFFLREILKEIQNPQMVFQRGGGAQGAEDSKQSVTDIDVLYKNEVDENGNTKLNEQGSPMRTGVGLQAKHYDNNSIKLYEDTIMIYKAQRYLLQDDIDAFLFLMGNNSFLTDMQPDFSYLLPFLYYRMAGFYRHINPKISNALQNNFYIINLNVVPASIIFLFIAQQIFDNYGNLTMFSLQGDVSENNFQMRSSDDTKHYNLFINYDKEVNDTKLKDDNFINKIRSFKIIFKGVTINIDNLNLSVFQKK